MDYELSQGEESEILIVDDKRIQEDFDNKDYQNKDPDKFPNQAIEFMTKIVDQLINMKHLSAVEQQAKRAQKAMTIVISQGEDGDQFSQ